ncbi:hypothetical protein CTEN210_01008 [Chaetoceros tenuissimus]|uniref:Uncharacterized protein n=1 Tax=Chaetoceros tenuissimus TaxID=426638 RepID=A0AAD3CGM6_9STRA|nr:hypothetical protein CTEN210_01008 [Chaetoceros tenuissimus]
MTRTRVPFIVSLAFGVILFQSQFSIHQKVFFEKFLPGNYNLISTNEASSIYPAITRASMEDDKQQRTNKLLYLNQTTAEGLQRANGEFSSTNPSSTFDILSISSKFNLKLSHAQHETFASHASVRNFIIATEDDDPDPTCYKTTTMEDVEQQSRTCKHYKHWQDLNALNKLTKYFSNGYANINWLKGKQNPSGWVCAQKRFHSAFVKYIELLQQSNVRIPDYLMIMDEDTYVNIHDLEKYLMQSSSMEKDDGNVPLSSQTPVIYAGCRVRAPVSSIKWTFPFGGWGIYLSQGAIKKWMAPIDCKNQENTEHMELCRRYSSTPSNSASVTIGEGNFFQNGMSLNKVFRLYLEKQDTYCLHGDWFFGYIANYLNISRHVIPTAGEYPVVGYGGQSAKYFDQAETGPENRLHTIMGSEQYKFAEGLCLYGNGMYNEDEAHPNEKAHFKSAHYYIPVKGDMKIKHRKPWRNSQKCIHNTTICHYVKDPENMKQLYIEAEKHRSFSHPLENNMKISV